MKKERLLTVGSTCYELDFDLVKVPFIRLSGKWLEAAGFHVGDMVNVEYSEKGLIIRKVEGLHQPEKKSPNEIDPAGKKLMKYLGKRICNMEA
jgi:hypothetical protein